MSTDITNEQIGRLRTQAHEHGDVVQAIICGIALDEYSPAGTTDRRTEVLGHALAKLVPLADERRLIWMNADAARAECARVIAP